MAEAEATAGFDCLWCGATYRPRDAEDLEAWAKLCPDCLARAGENAFLRFRLREALASRARSTGRDGSEPPTRERDERARDQG